MTTDPGLTPGTLHDCWRLVRDEPEPVHVGTYEILCIATHAQVRNELVVYVGVGGPDDGRHYACSLSDFRLRFTPAPEDAACPT